MRGGKLSRVLAVSTMLGCGSADLLRVEAPSADAPARVIIARSANTLSVHAVDGSTPLDIPGLIVDEAPLELTTLAYDRSLEALDFLGAPGPLTVVDPGGGIALWPALRGHRRVIDVGDDGAWQPITTLDPPIEVAPRPACRPLDAQPVIVPPDLDIRALYRTADGAATLVMGDGAHTRRAWFRVEAGRAVEVPEPVPGLDVREGVVGPDGTEWIAGVRSTTIAELWARPSGGVFAQVPPSPAMVATVHDGEAAWLAPLPSGALWIMTRDGHIERYRGGTWDRSIAPEVPIGGRNFGQLVAIDEDTVVALTPFVFDALQPRTIARVDARMDPPVVSRRTFVDPLPHAIVHAPDLEDVVVGSVNGRVYLLGARELEELGRQSMGSIIQAIVPVHHGRWRGVMYVGLNGHLREQYVGAETCLPDGLTFNASRLVDIGGAWLAAGPTQPPERRPSVAWIRAL